MSNEVVAIDFTNPKPLNLDDTVNLRDIFNTLVQKGGVSSSVDFNKWASRKLVYYTKNTDYFTFGKNVERSYGGSVRKEVATTVQVALEIIANGHKEAGHDMRRFLTNCLKLATSKPTTPTEFADYIIEIGMKLKQSEEANRYLTEALGIATDWKSAVAWKKRYPELGILADSDKELGKVLSRRCKRLGFSRRKIQDSRWGEVWTYERAFIETVLREIRSRLIK